MAKEKREKGVINTVESTAKSVFSRGEKVLFAGLDAVARVEEEGRGLLGGEKTSLLKDLVNEGRKFLDTTPGDSQFDRVQNAVRDSFDKAREQVGDTYDKVFDQAENSVNVVVEGSRLDLAFERRVAKSLDTLGYPSRAAFDALNRQVEQLSKQVAQLSATKAPARKARSKKE